METFEISKTARLVVLRMFGHYDTRYSGKKTIVVNLIDKGYILSTDSSQEIDFHLAKPYITFENYENIDNLVEIKFDIESLMDSEEFKQQCGFMMNEQRTILNNSMEKYTGDLEYYENLKDIYHTR